LRHPPGNDHNTVINVRIRNLAVRLRGEADRLEWTGRNRRERRSYSSHGLSPPTPFAPRVSRGPAASKKSAGKCVLVFCLAKACGLDFPHRLR